MTVWRPGMKAVCIKEPSTEFQLASLAFGLDWPKKGEVFTVTGTSAPMGIPYITLDRYIWELMDGKPSPGWPSDTFRPVQDTSKQVEKLKRETLGQDEKVVA